MRQAPAEPGGVKVQIVDWDVALLAGEPIDKALLEGYREDVRYGFAEKETTAQPWFNSWSGMYVI